MDDKFADLPGPGLVPPSNPYEELGVTDTPHEYSYCDYDEKPKRNTAGRKKGAGSKSATIGKSPGKSRDRGRGMEEAKVKEGKFQDPNVKMVLCVVGVAAVGVALLLCLGLAVGALTRLSSHCVAKEVTANLSWTTDMQNFFHGNSGSLPMSTTVRSIM